MIGVDEILHCIIYIYILYCIYVEHHYVFTLESYHLQNTFVHLDLYMYTYRYIEIPVDKQ